MTEKLFPWQVIAGISVIGELALPDLLRGLYQSIPQMSSHVG